MKNLGKVTFRGKQFEMIQFNPEFGTPWLELESIRYYLLASEDENCRSVDSLDDVDERFRPFYLKIRKIVAQGLFDEEGARKEVAKFENKKTLTFEEIYAGGGVSK